MSTPSLAAASSQLLVVDMQERLLPAVADAERVIARVRLMIAAAARLGVPVTVSEQYPKGLGATVATLREALSQDAAILPKLSFSCLGEPALAARLAALSRPQLVVCGAEAHVCVLQTALTALATHEVFIVADATSSRDPANARLAMDRARAAGCVIVSSEMVVFEWLERAGTDDFRALAPLLK
jgi:nicotinamidase-related amidase